MNFKNFLIVACIAIILVVVGCSRTGDKAPDAIFNPNENPTIADNPADTAQTSDQRPGPEQTAAGWYDINLRIWSIALSYVGVKTGQQCKEFASTVVKGATGYSLPSTQDNWIYLNSGHIYMIVDGNRVGGGTIESGIGFGNIIQMHIIGNKNLPHTAIFSEYAPGGMYWIDCNFVSAGTVNRHYVSWEWFRGNVGTRYSIYQATN